MFLGLINLLFVAMGNLGLELWSAILVEIVQNIHNRRNVRARIKLDFQETKPLAGNVILGNNSGFQRLSFLNESKVFFQCVFIG